MTERMPDGMPTVVVENQQQACAAAAAAAAAQLRLDIRSAAWVADAYGPMVFAAMIAAARRAYPDADIRGILDCGDSAGMAMAALRHGLDVGITVADPACAKLRQMAERSGRKVVTGEGPLLDLRGEPDPFTMCSRWVATLPDGRAQHRR